MCILCEFIIFVPGIIDFNEFQQMMTAKMVRVLFMA